MDAGGRELPRRKNGRIASYATIFTTQQTGKKTSQVGIFFAGNRLSPVEPKNAVMPVCDINEVFETWQEE
ncbi:MAG: hypothetical protein EPN17_15660 [Methylobacter sp.]|nr:MAG: hypothetical protein EPN17_15660 [Methylobacter sp.]